MLIKECLVHDIRKRLRAIDFEGKEKVIEAINLGWNPDVNAAIESYSTVCAELEMEEGHAEILIETYSYEDVVQAFAPIFVDQAETFLANQEVTIERTTLSKEACSGLIGGIREAGAGRVLFNDRTLIKEDGAYHIPDVTITIGSICMRGRLTFPNRDLGIHLIAFYSMMFSETKAEAEQWYRWCKERVKDEYYLEELKEILSGDIPSSFNPQ